ncbi:alpha/beta-hydrolase [Trichoderma citrinoviride]|uniref:Alpha/beta-hydrolase n=1 Tax=Trichoderma citrinoviride TaxID=58853 RepID=A0A2T4B6P8_9HYPO|nr:alpha/beta-hydrolase [Trichoderma citrinoviride]PTB64980.1 alpha/beta-hydrolase [Trichoderma citrinoviride]
MTNELIHGRIAYAHNGPPTSRTVIIFFVGIMGLGTAANVSEPCRELQAHWIAPTLPGMGRSGTRDCSVPYYVNLANDINVLLNHLSPTGDFDALYFSGGSYGTVPAQMLYGAPYDLFPSGRKIAGMLLLNGLSPLRHHAGYATTLRWNNWVSIGPPTRIIPFRLLQRLFKAVIGYKLRSVEGAKQFLKATVFDKMDDGEKQLDEHTVSDTIHSDWGFDPRTLDEEHSTKPVLVVGSKNDHIGGSTNDWLVANYKSAIKLKLLPGGHISSLFIMDELWRDLIEAARSA